MKSPPILALILCLCLLAIGCASTTQTMQPPGGVTTINLGTPDNPLACSGLTVVSINCQVGVTAKPVGLDVLNPAVSAAAQQYSGTGQGAVSAGPVMQTKPSVLPSDPLPVAVDKTVDTPASAPEVAGPPTESPEPSAKPAGDTASDGAPATPVAVEATPAAEDQPAAPSGGG